MANNIEFFMPFDAKLIDGSYDRTVTASEFSEYFRKFIGNGIYANPSNGFKVTAGSFLVLNVAPGSCFINGRYGSNKKNAQITLEAADNSYARIDRIVLRLDLAERKISIEVIKGTPSSSPQLPPIVRYDTEESGNFYDLCLANVRINAGTAVISDSNITDTRLDTSLCGIVATIIENVDTTDIFNQYQAYLDEQIVEWNKTKQQQEQEFQQQMDDIDAKEQEIQGWYDTTKATIFDTKYFDFDNFTYRKGFNYEVVKETEPNLKFTETIKNTTNSSVYATRISEKVDNNTWAIQTICSALSIDMTMTYTKQPDGSWKGVTV